MTDTQLQKDLAAAAEHFGFEKPTLERRDGPLSNKSGKRLPQGLRDAAEEVLAAYRASPDHAELMAALPQLSLADLHIRFQNALEGPHFAPLLQMLREPELAESDDDGFLPQSISLGLMAQAVLILGLSGSIGYVIDTDLKSGLYVGGAFDAGIDAGVEGDVCVGFWKEKVGDLDGIYVGEEVDIDDGTGVTEAAFLHDDELALVFVGVDLGIDDGMENTDFYFFEMEMGRAPIYQSGDATYLAQLVTMTCINSKDNYDTIYFEFYADGDDSTLYRYPAWDGYQMCEAQEDTTFSTWTVGMIAKFNTSLTLRLHVGDHTMDDVTVYPSSFGGLHGSITQNWDDKVDAFDEIQYSVVIQLIRN